MTGDEAKEALLNKSPVVFNGMEYRYISAIIYRADENKKIHVSVELYSNCGHSLTFAPIKSVDLKGTENGV